AGGFPIAAVVGKAEIMDAPLPGGLGGTYGGSPVGCAAALAVLDVLEQENLVERSRAIGAAFAESLHSLQRQFPALIGDIRQQGAMIAMELVKDGDPNQPNPELTQSIIKAAEQHGLILLACGFYGNVIRFLPPLTIEFEVMHEGLEKLEVLLHSLLSQR
ncbi:aminotransferase class III-fold pyridoxal phosphate-dependent enzyme, partial [Alkalimonas sp.]|uniref:aminotransferase class III-fold pyridoxal phosphate-dependent enzyme n=1 Tax=Alkalimonas sp. TaxID=1872453 RepID=UPI00263BAE71